MWKPFQPDARSETNLALADVARELTDLIRPLTTSWLSTALLRGVVLGLEFPSRVLLLPAEIVPVRVLLDGLVGGAIDAVTRPGGAVHVRVTSPSPAVLRLSVRHTRGAGMAAAARRVRGARRRREPGLGALREVARAHCGRLRFRRSRTGEIAVRVDLPRVG